MEKTKTLEQGELDRYFAQFLGASAVLMSSEELSALTLGELAKLRQSLSPFDTRIIFYKRNCLDVLPSAWQQRVKHGATQTLQEFLLSHILRPLTSRIVNPAVVVDLYASVFGKDRITIIDCDAVAEDILRPYSSC